MSTVHSDFGEYSTVQRSAVQRSAVQYSTTTFYFYDYNYTVPGYSLVEIAQHTCTSVVILICSLVLAVMLLVSHRFSDGFSKETSGQAYCNCLKMV